MKTTTSVKSGGFRWNHNHAAVNVKVKTSIKSGDGTRPAQSPGGGGLWVNNHNQSLAGVKVKTSIKSGAGIQVPIKIKHNV